MQREEKIRDSINNRIRPDDLNYESQDLAEEFKNIKLTDSLYESRGLKN